jgi:hypothetical protein
MKGQGASSRVLYNSDNAEESRKEEIDYIS